MSQSVLRIAGLPHDALGAAAAFHGDWTARIRAEVDGGCDALAIVLPAAQSTARLLSGRPVAEAMSWLRILIAFDIVFVVACALAFPFTLED